jgi:hypothetical protein
MSGASNLFVAAHRMQRCITDNGVLHHPSSFAGKHASPYHDA